MKYEVINYEENGWIFEVIKSNVKNSFRKLNKIQIIKKKKIQIVFHIHFDLIQKIDDSKINIILITHVDNIRKKLVAKNIIHPITEENYEEVKDEFEQYEIRRPQISGEENI